MIKPGFFCLLLIACLIISCQKESTDDFGDFQSFSGTYSVDNGTQNQIVWESNDSTVVLKEYNKLDRSAAMVTYTISQSPQLHLNLYKPANANATELDLIYPFKEEKEGKYYFEHPNRPYPRLIIIDLRDDSFDITYRGNLMDGEVVVIPDMEIIYSCSQID